jgi:hypothetical protein
MTYLTTIAVIFAVMASGIAVDRVYRRFAAGNPKLGPFRDSSKCGSCSSGSGCSKESCDVDDVKSESVPHS